MPSLVCHHLTFTWPTGETVFAGLDANFPDGLTGLVGRNGVGKSTLLRVLAGELSPSAGSVSGPTRTGYLPQQLLLDSGLTAGSVLGVDHVLAALDRVTAGRASTTDLELTADQWTLPDRIDAALADFGLAGLDLARTLGTLSGGEGILLALAGQLLAEPEVLILDEPTNNLDRSARGRLTTAVRRWRGPAILVSHDRALLDEVDHIGELRDGAIRFFGGNYSAYTEALAGEAEAAARGLRVAQGELRRQQRELVDNQTKLDRRRFGQTAYEQKRQPRIKVQELKRSAQVSGSKLSEVHQAGVERARGQLREAEDRVRDDDLIRIDLTETRVPQGRVVAVLDEVTLRTGRTVSLHLRGPERVGLTGANGSGKTTLIDTLRGALAPVAGQVDLRVPTRLLPQRLQLLTDDETVLAGVARHAPDADDNTLRAQLARFLLPADLIARPVSTLSGGERFRASLAALLLSRPAPQLLILDEPTNSLDLDSVRQLVAALGHYRGALLVASHDEPFLADLGLDRRLEL